jgi:hypothetical protein
MSNNDALTQIEQGTTNLKNGIPTFRNFVKAYKVEEKERGGGPNLTRSETKGKVDGYVANVKYFVTVYQNLLDTYGANLRTHEKAVVQLQVDVRTHVTSDPVGRVELKHRCEQIGAEAEALIAAQRVLHTAHKNLDYVLNQVGGQLPRNYQPNPVAGVKLKRPPFAPKTPKLPSVGAQITKQMVALAIRKKFKSDD